MKTYSGNIGISTILSAASNFVQDNAPAKPVAYTEINLLDDTPVAQSIPVKTNGEQGGNPRFTAGLKYEDLETTIKTLKQIESAVRKQEAELEAQLEQKRAKIRDEELNLNHNKYRLLSLIMHAGKTASKLRCSVGV